MKPVQSIHIHPQPITVLPLAILSLYVHAQIDHNGWANFSLNDWMRFSVVEWGSFTIDQVQQLRVEAQSIYATGGGQS